MKIDLMLRDILVSTLLLTRVPVPNLPDKWFSRQAQAIWAFPIVGALIGIIAAATILTAQHLGQPILLSSGLALAIGIILTGAMHEDGLADTADGFWGGYDATRRLEIMKDSQIGTYGVLALILSIGLRWGAITNIVELWSAWSLVPIAALSRAAMPVLMVTLPNARDSGLAHRVGTPGRRPVAVGIVFASSIGWVFLGFWPMLACLGTCAVALFGLHHLARIKIGGRTGDVLGSAQQLCEILCLLSLLSLG